MDSCVGCRLNSRLWNRLNRLTTRSCRYRSMVFFWFSATASRLSRALFFRVWVNWKWK